jgi:putative FmdB family regulatory protein
MPTYDYKCEACGHEFELFQRMTDLPERVCPQCGGEVRRKIGSGAGVIFKGSGFYATDYRSNDYKAKASSEKGVAPPSPKGDAGTTEPKKPADSSKETKGA